MSIAEGLVLVTGASGNVGAPLVRELLARGVAVRALDVDSDRARKVLGEGPEIVRFDFTERATWPAAFAGARSLFLLRPPQISDVRRELLPALDGAYGAGVEHVVFLSIQGAEKNRVVPHHKIERYLMASGRAWTMVRAAYFMQNLSTTHAADIRERNEVFIPAGHARTAFVDTRDVAAVAAVALAEGEQHHGRAYTPTATEALTYDEVAATLSQVLGRPIRYADPNVVRYWRRMRASGMPRAMVGVTLGIYTAARLGLAAGVTDDVERLTGRAPIDFAAFARDNADVWRREAD